MTKLKIIVAAICSMIGMATASAQVAVRADLGASSTALENLEREIAELGLGYRRFEFRTDSGVGFVFKRNNELVLGIDFGWNNRMINNLPKSGFMNSTDLYIGYRYRFGIKKQ